MDRANGFDPPRRVVMPNMDRTELVNPATGERVIVLGHGLDGDVIEGMTTFPPTTIEPVYHEHPLQEERFDVLAGTVLVRIEGKLRLAGPGERVVIPAGAAHQIANSGAELAQVMWQIEPALRTGEFLRATFGANHSRRCGRWRRFAQRVSVAMEYSAEYRRANLPWVVQRPVLSLLAWVAAWPPGTTRSALRTGALGRTWTFAINRLRCIG